jgi:hypothetical protein
MARYIVENIETKGIKKSLKKWCELPICTEHLEGVIKIKNYRRYRWAEEVDVAFEGKIFVRIGYEKRDWHTASILKSHNISKVKLNRFLRRNCLFDVKTRMKYFGVEIGSYHNIKKINWE